MSEPPLKGKSFEMLSLETAKAKAVRDWLVEHKKKCEYEGCKRQAQFEIYGEFYCYKHGDVLMDNLLTSKLNGFSLFLADKYRS